MDAKLAASTLECCCTHAESVAGLVERHVEDGFEDLHSHHDTFLAAMLLVLALLAARKYHVGTVLSHIPNNFIRHFLAGPVSSHGDCT